MTICVGIIPQRLRADATRALHELGYPYQQISGWLPVLKARVAQLSALGVPRDLSAALEVIRETRAALDGLPLFDPENRQ